MRLMQKHFSLIICFIIGICASSIAFSEVGEGQADGYHLLPGDILLITVWKESELQREVQINPDGKLSFPLLGHIQTAGYTAEALEKVITEKLNKYIPDSVVSMSLRSVAGNNVYVIGNVARPGNYNVTSYLDVMQVLSMAGGLTPFAAANDIKILRRINGKETITLFRYADVEAGKKLEQNIILKGGDVVVVP